MRRGHLVVFVKAPRLGQAKTRLAAGIGGSRAVAFYRRQTAALLARLGDRRWRLWLAVAAERDRAAPLWPAGLPRISQGRGDLGRRMLRPFVALPAGPVVLIGSDIPDVRRPHIAAAFRALAAQTVVFGPAADGGYWLIGMRRRPLFTGVFRSVRWSSPEALADTLANLRGRKVGFVATLQDVDTPEDYLAWRKRARTAFSRPGAARAP